MVKITLGDYNRYLFTGTEEELLYLVKGLRKLITVKDSFAKIYIPSKLVTVTIEDISPDQVKMDGSADALQAQLDQVTADKDMYAKWWREEQDKVKQLIDSQKDKVSDASQT